MTKSAGARESAPFLAPETERMPSGEKSQRRKRAPKGFSYAVVNGERVLVAKAPVLREKGIQLQIVTALEAAAVRVLQHRIFPCHTCGQRPTKETGLGEFAADILCVVPPYGRACFIEVKRPGFENRKRDEGQRKWADWIRRYGGVAGIATNVDQAFALIDLARRMP